MRKTFKTQCESDDNCLSREQALGYVILACKEAGLSPKQIKKVHPGMVSQFDLYAPNEATKKVENYLSLDNEIHSDWFQQEEKIIQRPKYKSALNLKIGKVTDSPTTKRLRRNNERLLMELQKIEDGPFKLFKLFKGCKK